MLNSDSDGEAKELAFFVVPPKRLTSANFPFQMFVSSLVCNHSPVFVLSSPLKPSPARLALVPATATRLIQDPTVPCPPQPLPPPAATPTQDWQTAVQRLVSLHLFWPLVHFLVKLTLNSISESKMMVSSDVSGESSQSGTQFQGRPSEVWSQWQNQHHSQPTGEQHTHPNPSQTEVFQVTADIPSVSVSLSPAWHWNRFPLCVSAGHVAHTWRSNPGNSQLQYWGLCWPWNVSTLLWVTSTSPYFSQN